MRDLSQKGKGLEGLPCRARHPEGQEGVKAEGDELEKPQDPKARVFTGTSQDTRTQKGSSGSRSPGMALGSTCLPKGLHIGASGTTENSVEAFLSIVLST